MKILNVKRSQWGILFLLFLLVVPLARSQNPVPVINQPLVPETAAPGGSGFTLVINGTGFVSTSVVNWNGSALSTTFVNSSQLKASVPSTDIASAGTASVTVSSGGVSSNVAYLEITNAASSVSFNKTSYSPGVHPTAVAVGDFNGDGKLDLAVANYDPAVLANNTVSVLLGNGDGTFGSPVSYVTGLGALSVSVGDFNGDGKLDLAVANERNGDFSVLLGNGDGTFQTPVSYTTVYGLPQMVAVADFNGDGKLDLATADSGSNFVSVLLGNGDGTFQPAAAYVAGSSTFSGPGSIAVGDFNGDGKLDLAVAIVGDNDVAILLGNGNGTFQLPVSYAVDTHPFWVTAADFNGDGKLDLAVANFGILNSSNGSVSVLLGNGDGTFQPAVNYGAGIHPLRITAGDINGDGVLDLAIGNDSEVSVLLGNGDGTFQTAVNYATDANAQGVAFGDFANDGKADLAVANYNVGGTGSLSVLLQTTPLTITANNVSQTLNGATPALTFAVSGLFNSDTLASIGVTVTCTTTATSSSPVGSYPITCSGPSSATHYSIAYVAGTLNVVYSTTVLVNGAPGHQILSPISADGSSVFKQGRTVPAQFRVGDANGVSIGTPGVVSSFFLTEIITGTTTTMVDDVVDTNNPDTAFRWDPTNQEWIFNITTKNLSPNSTYVYTITLNDGSTLMFQFGLR